MKGITLTLANRLDSCLGKEHDESKITYVPAGRIYLLVDDIRNIVEFKGKNACEIYLKYETYNSVYVVDDYDSIMKKIAYAESEV